MPFRIVIATFGSLGDVFPYLAVATGLKLRGHYVVVASQERYRERIEKMGFKFSPLRPDNRPAEEQFAKLAMDRWRGTETVLRHVLLPHAADTYDDLTEATRDADLLVTHVLVLPAPLFARKTGIPWISAALAPAYFLPVSNAESVRDWLTPYRKLESGLGLSPGGNPLFSEQYSSDLVLLLASSLLAQPQHLAPERMWVGNTRFLLSKLFGAERLHWSLRQWIVAVTAISKKMMKKHPQPSWPTSLRMTGFPFLRDEESPPETMIRLDAFLSEGPPPIVFTLGSTGGHAGLHFFMESVRAARSLGRRALLITGGNSEPSEYEWTKGPDVAVFRYIPYSYVFRRAAVVAHSAGIGTTALALQAGRPMLVVPISHDQPDTAARVRQLGVARVIPHGHYGARWAARELRSLLEDPQYSAKAACLARQIESEDGVRSACDAIEERLGHIAAPVSAVAAAAQR